jgi:hypothetical protein
MAIIRPVARICSLLYGTIIILTLYIYKLSKEILSLSRKKNIEIDFVYNHETNMNLI